MATGSAVLAEYLRGALPTAEMLSPGRDMPTVPLAAEALGVGISEIVKSIVLQGKKDESVIVLAIVSGDAKVASSKVAAALACPTLKLAPPQVVVDVTGYEVGGVPPVGHRTSLRVVVDPKVFRHDPVYGGGGDETHMLRIAPADIVRLTGAAVTDISADEKP